MKDIDDNLPWEPREINKNTTENKVKEKGYAMPKRWSNIKCHKCGYEGKPRDVFPEFGFRYIIFFPLIIYYLVLLIIYLIKYCPVQYCCPKCDNPRQNINNIEYIAKLKNRPT